MSMYETVLVTGGAGFIGSHLAIGLKTKFPDSHVIAFDNLKRRGSELNLGRLRDAGVRFVHGDVRCAEDLSSLSRAPQLVVECSAEPSAQAGYGESPEYLINTNLVGCINCLEICRRHRADLLFLSSSRVYPYVLLNRMKIIEDATRFRLAAGETLPGVSDWGISEDFSLRGARTLYGASKLASELLIEEYADAYGVRTIINRCGLVTGPGQMAKLDQGVFGLWMAAHHFQLPLRYIGFGGQGKQVRDFLHVEDLKDLILLQIESFDRYAGEIFNAGGGPQFSLSLRECTALCREITGNVIPLGEDRETRRGDVKLYVTDHRRISELSGWRPIRDARATLGDIHAWMSKETATLEPLFTNR
jgi:CDP-paratose 2-epimerase